MAETLWCFQPGERFLTLSAQGVARVWLVRPGGEPELTNLPERDQRPHSRACGINHHEHGPACAPDCPTCHPNTGGRIT